MVNGLRPLLIFLLLATICVGAEPRIDRLEPQGARRGSEQTVRITGPRLGEEPQELLLYEPGITVTALRPAGKGAVEATLQLAPDCPFGRHALRVRTSTGLSNLVTLHVGNLEAVAEVEPNHTLERAQAVPFNRTIHGVVKREDEDVFAIDVAKGQRVSLEVEGFRLGRTFFDPVIEVLDASGRLIAANDDQTASYSDPFLSLAAPESGNLYVRVRESAFRGDNRATYLLHIGDFPRPLAAYPPAVQRGADTDVRWIGPDNLTQSIPVPSDAGDRLEAHASDEQGVAPSENSLLVTESPPVLEVEPNDNSNKGNEFAVPAVVTGAVGSGGDIDFFRFQARKNQTLDLRVHARSLRSPLDAVLRVFDSKGKRLAGNDDDRGAPDSYLRFRPPSDGEYRLQIEDRLGRGDAAFTYAIEVTPPQRVAEVRLEERRRYEATVLEVPQGGRCAALITVTRRDFGGDVELGFTDLPVGVTAECFPLAGNFNRVPVVFSAAPDAELTASLSRVLVTPLASDKPMEFETEFRQQTWLIRGRNNRPMWSHFADRAPVAVTRRLPFSLTLEQPTAPLFKNGSLELKVTAQRDEGFDQSVGVRMLYHSPGVSSNRSRSVVKGATEARIPVTANGNARTGAWPIVVVGETNYNGRVFVSTQFVTLTVAEALFDIGVPTVTARQGDDAELKVSLTHRTPFDGKAKLELVGLPSGVAAEPVEVAAGDASATFALAVAPNTRPGRHRGIGVRASLMMSGQAVHYRHGYSELRIDPPLAWNNAPPFATR